VTHILRHLRFEKAWEIFKEEKYDKDRAKRRKIRSRTFCGEPFDEFMIKYRNRKQLDIWKLRDPKEPWKRNIFGYELDENGRKIMDTVAHVTLFDSHPFFQQSFVKAAEFLVKIGKADKADFDFMKEMKRKRDRFSSETLEQIKAYTELELRYLAQVVTELRQILHDIKLDCAPDMKPIHISNWCGPGAIASAFLKNLDIIKNHYGDHVRSTDLSPIQIAAHHALSAGNIQLVKVGRAPDLVLHSMDIASAHPHASTQLPSMAADGRWNKIDDGIRYNSLTELKVVIEASSIVSMFYLDYAFPLYEHFEADEWKRIYVPWYPLFFRSRMGAIFYPRRGEGWHMRDDALAAIQWLERFAPATKWREDGSPVPKQWELKDTRFIVKQAWIFTPRDTSEKPFAFLEEIYRQWMEYKHATPYDAREKFYKLPPNSICGKMAQRVGGSETKDGWKAPPTATPFYAAAITANCRRRLVEAGLRDPHAVVAFMTDGIVTTRRLEGLPNVVKEGGESHLGDWEYAPVQGGTFLHAGVYSMRKAGEELTKTRAASTLSASRRMKARPGYWSKRL
jgi:hypothetical protein